MVFATTRGAFPFSPRLLVAQLVVCAWWLTAANLRFECARQGDRSYEECCTELYHGEKWSYNYLKQLCRVACEDGAYFDEEAHECVFADGVECFECHSIPLKLQCKA